MDYVEGESLKHKIFDAKGPVPFDQIAAVMSPLCQALDYAHKQGFVHADVKPGNILMDDGGRVMLMDFGIARMTESATVTMLGAGTPAYMSPEQAKGKPPTPQSDIYALGIILYEMLTGERPFNGELATSTGSTGEKIRWEQLNLNPISTRRFNRQISDELDMVVMRCLEKNPQNRFSNALELLNALAVSLPALVVNNKRIDYLATPREEPVPSSARQESKLQPEGERSVSRKIQTSLFIWLIGGIAVILLGLVLGGNLITPATPIPTLTATLTLTPLPLTNTFTPYPTNTPIASPTPKLGIGSIFISNGVTMMYIPAGTFPMGEENGDNEKLHSVYLDGYYIDKYEVTNSAYRRCVDVGKCIPPKQSNSDERSPIMRSSYYGNAEFDEFPVIYVDWDMAKTYCEWRDARLPTEAEWEKAARGKDERTYPWGEGINCDKANYDVSCIGDTTKVGSYESGKSVYGVYDMVGNVWEWVNDWYSETYYLNSPPSNPLGPDSGQYHVLRGSSFGVSVDAGRSTYRFGYTPDIIGYGLIGFRCVRSLP
jgi:formylglycine-generating enzyme required for sulfatase activity